MKKIILSILLLSLFVSIACAKGNTITIKVHGIKEIKGKIVIGLYNKAKTFPDIGKQHKGIISKITTKSATYIFSDIPDGIYAIALFQDLNNNGDLDYNFFGIPEEPYAFSCISGACFKKPGFNKAKFKLKGNHTFKIKLH